MLQTSQYQIQLADAVECFSAKDESISVVECRYAVFPQECLRPSVDDACARHKADKLTALQVRYERRADLFWAKCLSREYPDQENMANAKGSFHGRRANNYLINID